MITDHLGSLVGAAFEKASADGSVPLEAFPTVHFERPKRREHGDWATNVALAAARGARMPPRAVAEAIAGRLPPSDLVDKVEVAGPGFLNFRLSPRWLHDVVLRASDPAESFGRTHDGRGASVNIEYVSSNPTGPINVVSGRHAAVGDAVASLFEATGYRVMREYYWNNAGRQMTLFAQSIEGHYLRHFGIDADIPEEGYKGDYVAALASEIADEIGDAYVGLERQERLDALLELGAPRVLESIRRSLERFGTRFDMWFGERTLHESGALDEALHQLRVNGRLEDRDGALWFKSSELGDDKDRVLVRSSGAPTYFAADVAYLVNKFGRGFERLVYLLGPDHHGWVPRLLAAAEALGFDRGRVEVPFVQIVTLSRGGASVKGSKRAGVYVSLDDLIDEVGVDAARYTFLMRSRESPLDFDIELVKQQAPENPVYYVQYAHARISSILTRADREGAAAGAGRASLDRLGHPSEMEVMRKLAAYEDTVPEAAFGRAPHRITRYVEELASAFSAFYRDCKVISEDTELTSARLTLCVATKRVIADALGLLGVSAPDSM
jgi:arginyl-tRNA synthetase